MKNIPQIFYVGAITQIQSFTNNITDASTILHSRYTLFVYTQRKWKFWFGFQSDK